MWHRRSFLGWTVAALFLLPLPACVPGANDSLNSDGRGQCSPVHDANCRPKYCPTGSKHECAAQDLCDNFFTYQCFDPTVDTAWSQPQEPEEASLSDEFTAPFSAASKMSLWRIANPSASPVPLAKYQYPPDDIFSSDYVGLVVEQFVQPALSLEDGLWDDLNNRIQTDPAYALRTAKKHALIYENIESNSQWIRLFSRVLFGQEHGSMDYCQPWLERLHNPPDPSEYNAQLDRGTIISEVSACLDMYGQVLAYLFAFEERSQLFSRSHTYTVLQSLEQTLLKVTDGRWRPGYTELLENEYAAIADVHDTLRAFIEPTTSMLLRAQASYAWLNVKTPGVYRREAPTEIGKLAQRAAEEAYKSSIDPQQAGSWQAQYRRALTWYSDIRRTELQKLHQLVGNFSDLDVLEHRWYFWGLMEASGLLELYPEYTAYHAELKAGFQADLQRAAEVDRTRIACAGFALSFLAPTAILKAAKGVKAAVWAGRATKLALGAAILVAIQTASAERPDYEESGWMAMLRLALPTLVSVDFWRDYGGMLAPQVAEAFAPSCFALWEQNHIAEYLDAEAAGLAQLNSLTSVVLHAGMTGADSLVEPDMTATADPAWSLILLPTEHPEYAVGTKQVAKSDGYELFARDVGAARAAYGARSTGRVRVTFAEHLESVGDTLTTWEEQAIPIWQRLGRALYGPEDWTPRFSTQSMEALAAHLAGILTSERPSRYDETWMELVRHMRSNPSWTVQDTETAFASLSAALGTRSRATLTSLVDAVRETQQADIDLVNRLLNTIQALPYQGIDWQNAVQVSNELQQLQMRLVALKGALDRQVASANTVASRPR